MKMKTGLLALGMFTIAGAVTISCGGSSDSDDGTGSKAGTTSTAGSGTGGNSTAGTTNSGGGTTNTTAGTTNNNGGTTNPTGGNATTGGTNNNNGGNVNNNGGAPDMTAGGAGPMGCPAAQPMDGDACQQGDGGFLGCTYGDQNCRCRRMGGQMRTWQCDTVMGAGGAGPGGTVTCPANAMDGDDCTGIGMCPGQQGCVCFNENVNCF